MTVIRSYGIRSLEHEEYLEKVFKVRQRTRMNAYRTCVLGVARNPETICRIM